MKFHKNYSNSDLDQKINELQTYTDNATTYLSILMNLVTVSLQKTNLERNATKNQGKMVEFQSFLRT